MEKHIYRTTLVVCSTGAILSHIRTIQHNQW